MSFTVYPALDIRNGAVVRLLQGELLRGGVLLGGRAADMLGRRRVFLAAVLVFGIASALIFPAVFFPFVDRLEGTLWSFALFALAPILTLWLGFGMAPKIAQVMADLILDGQDAIPDGFRLT